jgi:hypothetical protein
MAIQLHKKDIDLLNKIRGYYGNVGFITIGEKYASFRVQSLEEITANIIPRGLPASSRFSGGRSHFDKYPLITHKQADRARAQRGPVQHARYAGCAGYLLFRVYVGNLVFNLKLKTYKNIFLFDIGSPYKPPRGREIIPRGIDSCCLASKGGELVPSGEQEQKYPFLDPTPKGVGSTPSGLDP